MKRWKLWNFYYKSEFVFNDRDTDAYHMACTHEIITAYLVPTLQIIYLWPINPTKEEQEQKHANPTKDKYKKPKKKEKTKTKSIEQLLEAVDETRGKGSFLKIVAHGHRQFAPRSAIGTVLHEPRLCDHAHIEKRRVGVVRQQIHATDHGKNVDEDHGRLVFPCFAIVDARQQRKRLRDGVFDIDR